jgi:trimeric autotransporter adhesin
MIADRAHAWSVAQERSAADLAFDFVTPELVLAARVYGLGPAEAAQAARLAIAGPGALASMASTVDRTFVQALAIEAERRERVQAVTAYPRGATATPPGSAPSTAAMLASEAAPVAPVAPPMHTFGVDRRPPRGAFMWPPATVAALGLTAATPDGEQATSLAALELLAAHGVAELGTYAALGAARPDAAATSTSTSTSDVVSAAAAPATAAVAAPSDSDALAAAVAAVPTARRAKLEAVFHALGQSSTTRSWSPAARAARALALAGRGDDTITAYERASIAWDVLPVVAPAALATELASRGAIDELAPGASRSTGSAAQRATIALPEYIEGRPGLAALSARAGEALGSYVAPAAAPSLPVSSSSRPREGAVLRAPTAAPELVRTGGTSRSGGRFGGGEVEIPTWFEAAARRMFDERSSGGPSSELSLGELTLITAAPATQVAASSRALPGAAPSNPSVGSQSEAATAQTAIDVEKVANEVYRQVLVLMDAARFRNGEPYL